MTTQLTKAVKAAIDRAPCSVRRLADDAGVPQSTLSRISAGRLEASPELARAVTKALLQWGNVCHKAAERIRLANTKEG